MCTKSLNINVPSRAKPCGPASSLPCWQNIWASQQTSATPSALGLFVYLFVFYFDWFEHTHRKTQVVVICFVIAIDTQDRCWRLVSSCHKQQRERRMGDNDESGGTWWWCIGSKQTEEDITRANNDWWLLNHQMDMNNVIRSSYHIFVFERSIPNIVVWSDSLAAAQRRSALFYFIFILFIFSLNFFSCSFLVGKDDMGRRYNIVYDRVLSIIDRERERDIDSSL